MLPLQGYTLVLLAHLAEANYFIVRRCRMKTAHYILVLLALLILATILFVPAEDVSATAFDESQPMPFQMTAGLARIAMAGEEWIQVADWATLDKRRGANFRHLAVHFCTVHSQLASLRIRRC